MKGKIVQRVKGGYLCPETGKVVSLDKTCVKCRFLREIIGKDGVRCVGGMSGIRCGDKHIICAEGLN